jgi:hypothetical protein
MQQMISILAAVTSLAMPQTSMTNNVPVAVSTCAISDLIDSPTFGDSGPAPISYRVLRLTFSNTQDDLATRVTFDVQHAGQQSRIVDSGRFSKDAAIEHVFGDFNGTYGTGPTTCTIAAVTYADGSTWTPDRGHESIAASIR